MAAEQRDLRISLGAVQQAVDERLARLQTGQYLRRLWERDPTLWGDDPDHHAVARNRLGWLDSPRAMQAHLAELRAFAGEVRGAGITHAVLLGMGGSSLAPEVFRLTYGTAAGGIGLSVLDNTSPAAVRAVVDTHDPAHTLFVVSSKSGGTIEVRSFEAYFYEWMGKAIASDAGSHFVAVTDPDTALQRLASDRGYRRVWTNAPDIGGRYSALSFFGLLPAALIGIDLEALLAAAGDEAAANSPATAAADAPGVRLGAMLGELGLAGRDKVTIVTGSPFESFGSWAEQLIAESTGKDGRGLVPVAEEMLGAPCDYGDDRVFVAFSVDPLPVEISDKLDALEAAGQPVIRWRNTSVHTLGAEFLRWEIATAVASSVLSVDPFDEPNVTEAKQATSAVLERFLDTGAFAPPAFVSKHATMAVEASKNVADAFKGAESEPHRCPSILAAHAQASDYIGLLAYVHRTPELHQQLQALRLALRSATRRATTLGYGPRFLHSTGQLHKGGANNGVFIQLTADEEPDAPIPGQAYGFSALRWSQAAGDFEILEKRDRRVIRVRLGADPTTSLRQIVEATRAAAAH